MKVCEKQTVFRDDRRPSIEQKRHGPGEYADVNNSELQGSNN